MKRSEQPSAAGVTTAIVVAAVVGVGVTHLSLCGSVRVRCDVLSICMRLSTHLTLALFVLCRIWAVSKPQSLSLFQVPDEEALPIDSRWVPFDKEQEKF